MQNPAAATQQLYYHPHLDINAAHTIWNPVTQAKLDPASLLITSLGARITGIYFDPNIPNSYFAKAYLPNAILTGYKDGVLRTAEGHVFACIHFNHADRRVFDLAALNILEPDSHVMTQNNVKVLTCPSSPSTFPPTTTFHQPPTLGTALPMNAGPTNGPSPVSLSTPSTQLMTPANVNSSDKASDPLSATVYHATTDQTTVNPSNTTYPPLPTFLWSSSKHAYEELITFGSTQAEDYAITDNDYPDQYTPIKQQFLAQVHDYCRGKEELCWGIKIPKELCAGQYLEGLGQER